MSSSLLVRLVHRLWLLLIAHAALAGAAGAAPLRPSDCKPRDADSTCATAVAAATSVASPFTPDGTLYDGPLAGVPSSGAAYWGFDFVADQTGTPSPVRPDEFVNRSGVPVTITLTFDIPTDHACRNDCLPGMQFQVDAGWYKVDPPYAVKGNTVSLTATFQAGQGYGWLIGLWQASNTRLTVSVPKGSTATLADVGLPAAPGVANEIPAVVGTCDCPGGTSAACSSGSHFSNGLLGPWYQQLDMYQRSGAFNACAIDH
jgi:hypothetical protein